MTAATIDQTPPPTHMNFASSESKAVGMGGTWVDKVKDNAPRIVGGMKLAGDIGMGLIGHPLMILYSAFAITSRLIMIGFGTKTNQQDAAKAYQSKLSNETGTLAAVKKALHPKAYPIEASSASSSIAEVFGISYGVYRSSVVSSLSQVQDAAKELKQDDPGISWEDAIGQASEANGMTLERVTEHVHHIVDKAPEMKLEDALSEAVESSGITLIISGTLALSAYLFALLGKERITEKEKAEEEQEVTSLPFAQSTSKPQSWLGKKLKALKDNPIFSSSIVNGIDGVVMIVGGLMKHMQTSYIVAGALYLTSNILMAATVTKKKFNIEGAQEDEQMKQTQASFTEKELTKSQASGELSR